MAFAYFDKCGETASNQPTSSATAFNLSGTAPSGHKTIASRLSNGNLGTFKAESADGTSWQTFVGTYSTGTPNTLAQTLVLESTNSDSAVNWSSVGEAPTITLVHISQIIQFRGVLLELNAATQSIPDNTATNLIWKASAPLYQNPTGWVDDTNDTTRAFITVPSNYGIQKLMLMGGVAFDANATGYRQCALGSEQTNHGRGAMRMNAVTAASNETLVGLLSSPMLVSDGDQFKINAKQTSGGSLNVIGGTTGIGANTFLAAMVVE